jgi:hypothetical protein
VRRLVAALALCAAGASSPGCQENPSQPAAASAEPSASAGAAPSASASSREELGADYRDEDLPVPGDFEEEAEKAVTADNYKDKLAELKAELGPEEAASAAPSATAAPPPSASPSAAPE